MGLRCADAQKDILRHTYFFPARWGLNTRPNVESVVATSWAFPAVFPSLDVLAIDKMAEIK